MSLVPGVRHRVSPISPVITAVTASGALLVAMLVFGLRGGSGPRPTVVLIAGAAAAVFVLALVVEYAKWRRFEFWLDPDGDLRVDSGVVFRNERRLQLSRLQSVDVVRPLLARLAGMAALQIEVAGSGDSRAKLAYLPVDQAEALRAEILARAAGERPEAGVSPERILALVPPHRLLVSSFVRVSTLILLALSLVFLAIGLLTLGARGLVGFLITTGLPGLAVFKEFSTFYGFTVAEAPDGMRIRHGLFQTESRTVPPGRVAAVDVVEPWLWRRLGWARIRLTVAGVARAGSDGERQETVLIPVGPKAEAYALLARLMPGLDPVGVALVGVPARVRRRSPVQWRYLGVGANDEFWFAQRGRFTRHLCAVPHARAQSVRLTRGPWERALGLASVHVDVVPGPIAPVALHRPAQEARALLEEQVGRAQAARRSELPE